MERTPKNLTNRIAPQINALISCCNLSQIFCIQKEKACDYKKREKNGQVSEVELGAKAHLKKRRKKNKDSPCFSAIVFKSKLEKYLQKSKSRIRIIHSIYTYLTCFIHMHILI
jgi:hypothetical protein